MTEFTTEECQELYFLLDSLSGGNAENVFAWDGTDDPSDPGISAAVKLFKACGRSVPEETNV